jgi:hypothetical protein
LPIIEHALTMLIRAAAETGREISVHEMEKGMDA